MSIARRLWVVFSVTILGAFSSFPFYLERAAGLQTPDIRGGGADLQRRPGPPKEMDTSMLPTDRLARRRIEAAEDYVKAKAWPEVVRILQPLLDTSEDVLIPD